MKRPSALDVNRGPVFASPVASTLLQAQNCVEDAKSKLESHRIHLEAIVRAQTARADGAHAAVLVARRREKELREQLEEAAAHQSRPPAYWSN